MLCIALLALVVFEKACIDHELQLLGDNAYAMSAPLDYGQNDGGSKAPSVPPVVTHHCCSAHGSAVALAQASPAAPERVTLATPVMPKHDIVLANAPDNLERPPKTITSA